jgi:tyrosyl-tRNA synthetase
MPKVLTDIKLIEKFLTRGVEDIYPSKDELREKLMSGKRLRVYQGFDPTGPYLHIGHAMGIRALRILQQLGHEVIFLIGDFTSKVGDPDKDTAREMLSDEMIQKNMENWKEQASQLIEFDGENPVLFKHNYEWLSKLNLAELIKLMSNSTVQQLIERDLFKKRMEKQNPIGLHEFIYPLMQGYDSVAMQVDLEIGGTDQIFNMLMGRTLVKSYLGKEKFVRAHKLMEAPDQLTMSKTKGNGINLNDSPENIYGKAMSYSDELITKGLRLLTDVDLELINNYEKSIQDGENPMTYKKILAYEIVKLLKGEDSARKAQEHFETVVQKKQVLEEYSKVIGLQGEMPVLEFLKEVLGSDQSTTNIRRVIEQGGVEINDEKITDPTKVVNFEPGVMVKFGKREFFKIQ